MIRRISGGYRTVWRTKTSYQQRRYLGAFASRAAAEKRKRYVQLFKGRG